MSRSDQSLDDSDPCIIEPDSPRIAAIRSALIVVAHPDDVEAHCGGAVGLLTGSGCSVHLVICTSGEKGTADRTISPRDLGRMREDEQNAAAHILGIRGVSFLRYPDGEVPSDARLREQIVRHVRREKPDLVLTHDPEFPWPAYIAHRDHRAVGRVTLDALYPDARDHLFFPEQINEEGLEPHTTPEAWLFMSRIPDLFVDISAVIDLKIAARLSHASQHTDPAALDQSFRARAANLGAQVGLPFAEALKVVRFA